MDDDPETGLSLSRIQAGREEIKRGEWVSFEEFKKEVTGMDWPKSVVDAWREHELTCRVCDICAEDLVEMITNAHGEHCEHKAELSEAVRIAGEALGTAPELRSVACVTVLAKWCETLCSPHKADVERLKEQVNFATKKWQETDIQLAELEETFRLANEQRQALILEALQKDTQLAELRALCGKANEAFGYSSEAIVLELYAASIDKDVRDGQLVDGPYRFRAAAKGEGEHE